MSNIDYKTVEGFGQEWATFDQSEMSSAEHQRLFDIYFSEFPFDDLPDNAEGFDLGCGSGRWAVLAAPKVGHLHCIDPAAAALEVARKRLAGQDNASFHVAGSHEIPLEDGSQDFGYSLGVLHHIPDTESAMADCTRKLKPGAPFLVYIYYRFDNRPAWYRGVWWVSDRIRWMICRLPFQLKRAVTTVLAGLIYWPLARAAKLAEKLRLPAANMPLHSYRNRSFYTMRTDSLDRFGTRLENRFTRAEITQMMQRCGLTDISFRDDMPFWTACGRKR